MIYSNSNLSFQSIPLPNSVKICPKNGFKSYRKTYLNALFRCCFQNTANMLLCKKSTICIFMEGFLLAFVKPTYVWWVIQGIFVFFMMKMLLYMEWQQYVFHRPLYRNLCPIGSLKIKVSGMPLC